ncbi:VIT domain-containing protein [Chloroflexota bacterium]
MPKESCCLVTKKGKYVPLKGVEVRGQIIGRSARISLSQYFRNEEKKALEAVYKFPLPENCSICGFRAEIDDKIIQGRVEEKTKAFKKYDEALMRGDGGFLLDEERPNIFTISVGNLKPKTSVAIHIDYVTLLDSHDSEVRFFLPTTISPRYIPFGMKDENGIPVDDLVNPPTTLKNYYGMKINIDIQGKENIYSLESPSHPISTTYKDDSISVGLTSETTGMDRDFILNIQYQADFETRGYLCQANDEHFIQLDFSPKILDDADQPESSGQEIIFVLDCSGSMGGTSIAEAKQALTILLRALEPGSKFNIYRFGSSFTSLFKKSMDYKQKNLDIALQYVTAIDANLGGTEVLAPLKDIQKNMSEDRLVNVILLTDGEVGNEKQVFDLVSSPKKRMRLFTVGIGSGPNEYFIKQLASRTSGASEMVNPNERIEDKVLRLFAKVSSSNLVQNLNVNWNADVITSHIPQIIYAKETVSLFAKMRDDTGIPENVRISGEINSRKHEWVVDIDTTETESSPLPQLWARSVIQKLEESAGYASGSRQLRRKQSNVKQEIIDVSTRYGIISGETSYVAEEIRPDSEKSTGEIVLRKVPVMLTTGWGGIESIFTATFGAQQSPSLLKRRFEMHSMDRLSTVGDVRSLRAERLEDVWSPGETVYGELRDAELGIMPRHQAVGRDEEFRPRLGKKKSITGDGLLQILALQEVNGGFAIDKALAKDLKMSVRAIKKMANKIQSTGNPDKFILLSTALVLTYLRNVYKDRKDTWESVVNKSEKWFEDQVALYSPKLESLELLDWAETFLKVKGLIK